MLSFQLKITLSENPSIWRRIIVPEDYSFNNLHIAIQDSMGWEDYHLYEFVILNPISNKEERIGKIDEEFVDDIIDSENRYLKGFLNTSNRTAQYIYDYGDYWKHFIELEQILNDKNFDNLPICTDGEGSCPPEDFGGIEEYSKIINNTYKKLSKKLKSRLVPFIPDNVKFRRPDTSNNISNNPSENRKWLHKLLQGQLSESDIIQELCKSIPKEDILKLYSCILNSSLRYRNRAVALLAIHKNIPINTITEFLFITKSTVLNIQGHYTENGISGILTDKNKRLLKHQKTEYIEKAFSILHTPPSTYGYNRTTWKQSDLKDVMTREGLSISKGGLAKIFSDAGYKYKKARKVLTSNDPDYQEKLEEITRILSNLKSSEKFFSIDEYGPFAIKIQGGNSLVAPGTFKSVPQWQKSKGSLIMTAALELSTNQITHFYSKKKNTEEMIKLLNILIRQYSNEETIYFSWDAASWHASKKLYEAVDEINSDKYRIEHKSPVVKLAPLPTCAQFLNVIESVFSGMARAIIHNSNYQSVDECKTSIDKYFDERNENFRLHPKKAGNKIWGKERVLPTFSESNNCKDPLY